MRQLISNEMQNARRLRRNIVANKGWTIRYPGKGEGIFS
jgi:hypothetical protein